MEKVQSLYHVELDFWARNQYEADLLVGYLRAYTERLLAEDSVLKPVVSDVGFDSAKLS